MVELQPSKLVVAGSSPVSRSILYAKVPMFFLFAAFFPRLTLLIGWAFSLLPANDTPFMLDVICALLAPRLLVAWWGWHNGLHPLWSALFVALQFSEWMIPRVREIQVDSNNRR